MMKLGLACKRKLLALDHPQASTIEELDEQGFRLLVLWLENRKIRFYTEEDRAPLAAVTAPMWNAAFLNYLNELGAGRPSLETHVAKMQVVDWLASYAVGMEYSDKADTLAKIRAVPSQQPAHTATAPAQAPAQPPAKILAVPKSSGCEIILDMDKPDFTEALHKLADVLSVPHDDSPEAMIKQCASVLRLRFASSCAASVKSKGSRQHRPFDINDYPPGFDTGDPVLNKAASILRLLYVGDLRRLQDGVNQIIMEMQEYTANPRTDSRLGRVGR